MEEVRRIGAEVAAQHASSVDLEARFPQETMRALADVRLLSTLLPSELGGHGTDILGVARMCEALGEHCAASAMVFAMHQIQVACLVRHGLPSAATRNYLRELADKQLLIASVTSELGVGGDMRSSVCAVQREALTFHLEKQATTISYGEHADDLLVTARRASDAAPGDQVLVLVRKGDFTLERGGGWNTLGMRGTCSPPFKLRATGDAAQILDAPFADIASRTMVPVSHVLWSSLWLGIASGAVNRARAFVREQARQKPGAAPPGALRLAELMNALQCMRATVHDVASSYATLAGSAEEELTSIGFAMRINNLKIAASQQVVEIVHRALLICGIAGYKNEGQFSLGRHLRDAHSAALMVGNDRIYATNAQLALVLKD